MHAVVVLLVLLQLVEGAWYREIRGAYCSRGSQIFEIDGLTDQHCKNACDTFDTCAVAELIAGKCRLFDVCSTIAANSQSSYFTRRLYACKFCNPSFGATGKQSFDGTNQTACLDICDQDTTCAAVQVDVRRTKCDTFTSCPATSVTDINCDWFVYAKTQATTPTQSPPTSAPLTLVPGSTAEPTQIPPTDAPPTLTPGTTYAPPTDAPNTSVPLTDAPPTLTPTLMPGATAMPTLTPGDTAVPTGAPDTAAPPTDTPTLAPGATYSPPTDAPPTLVPGETNTPTAAPVTAEPTVSPPTGAPDTLVPGMTSVPTEAPATLTPGDTAVPTTAPATEAPATDAPDTQAPPTLTPGDTYAPPTDAPNTTAPADTLAPNTTAAPTAAPNTSEPTAAPNTSEPTEAPNTSEPTAAPNTSEPTVAPPTVAPPTLTPGHTHAPPTDAPNTTAPTDVPTAIPTQAPPTETPTLVPTLTPGTTHAPTSIPDTDAPPTDAPPTDQPTSTPTDAPPTDPPATLAPNTTQSPTVAPPTAIPTTAPNTTAPTVAPPTLTPTACTISDQTVDKCIILLDSYWHCNASKLDGHNDPDCAPVCASRIIATVCSRNKCLQLCPTAIPTATPTQPPATEPPATTAPITKAPDTNAPSTDSPSLTQAPATYEPIKDQCPTGYSLVGVYNDAVQSYSCGGAPGSCRLPPAEAFVTCSKKSDCCVVQQGEGSNLLELGGCSGKTYTLKQKYAGCTKPIAPAAQQKCGALFSYVAGRPADLGWTCDGSESAFYCQFPYAVAEQRCSDPAYNCCSLTTGPDVPSGYYRLGKCPFVATSAQGYHTCQKSPVYSPRKGQCPVGFSLKKDKYYDTVKDYACESNNIAVKPCKKPASEAFEYCNARTDCCVVMEQSDSPGVYFLGGCKGSFVTLQTGLLYGSCSKGVSDDETLWEQYKGLWIVLIILGGCLVIILSVALSRGRGQYAGNKEWSTEDMLPGLDFAEMQDRDASMHSMPGPPHVAFVRCFRCGIASPTYSSTCLSCGYDLPPMSQLPSHIPDDTSSLHSFSRHASLSSKSRLMGNGGASDVFWSGMRNSKAFST